MTDCCHAPLVHALPPRGEPRCAYCGHRQPVDGMPPVESRRLPPLTWPGELLGRALARAAFRYGWV